MSDYSETFTKVDGNTIEAADFETEFQAIETAIATKYDKSTFLTGYAGGALTSGTVDSPSGVGNTDFTGIPTWAKRVIAQMYDISASGATVLETVLGTSGGLDTTADYIYTFSELTNGAAVVVNTSSALAKFRHAIVTDANGIYTGRITYENITGNVWVCTSTLVNSQTGKVNTMGGSKTLTGDLSQIRVQVASGTFDAGSVNIMYEG